MSRLAVGTEKRYFMRVRREDASGRFEDARNDHFQNDVKVENECDEPEHHEKSVKNMMLELRLRIGARVTVTANYNQWVGVVNGTVGEVVHMTADTVYLRLTHVIAREPFFEWVLVWALGC